MIVEDNPSDREVAERALADKGFRVILATDGNGALREAEKHSPAAVVLDLLMPGMGGFEFLSKFRETRTGRSTPVIVWTAADLTAEQASRLRSAAQSVLLKSNGGTTALLEEIARHLPNRQPLIVERHQSSVHNPES
jgi:CheY-like chemotaxis protein